MGLALTLSLTNLPIFAATILPCPFGQAALQQRPEVTDTYTGRSLDPFYNPTGPMYVYPTEAIRRAAMEATVYEGAASSQVQKIKAQSIAVPPNTCLILITENVRDGISKVRIANGKQAGKTGFVDSAWLHWENNDSYYEAVAHAKQVNVHKTACTSGPPDLGSPVVGLGEQGVLWIPAEPGRSVSVYPTLQAYYAAATLTNSLGAEAAALQVKAGTCAVIIGSFRETGGFQILNIRILNGPHRGETGYIPQRWLYEPQ